VVTAQVLPSNGLTDLINILGNRVAAALPPSLQPGDLFTAQVTGFNGPQILLQFSDARTRSVGGSAGARYRSAADEPLSALAAATSRPLLPDGVAPSLAPPPAVFVAASVARPRERRRLAAAARHHAVVTSDHRAADGAGGYRGASRRGPRRFDRR